jgi:hypothetical protein
LAVTTSRRRLLLGQYRVVFPVARLDADRIVRSAIFEDYDQHDKTAWRKVNVNDEQLNKFNFECPREYYFSFTWGN